MVTDVAGEESHGVLPDLAPPAEAPADPTHSPAVRVERDAEPPGAVAADNELRLDARGPGELAEQVGAELSSDTGCIVVDDHQRTSVPGLYAAGDVVLGLDQISHAMGEGGVAATTIRNDLAKQRPLWRQRTVHMEEAEKLA